MIYRNRRRLAVCVTLLVLNLAFIWGNSLLPGESSGAFSEWVRKLLSSILPPAGEPEDGHFLRKFAHFSEFASLGFLLAWLTGMLGRRPAHVAAFSLLIGFVSACADETIQIFSPGRCPSPVDVGIDTAGVAVGIGLLLLGHCLLKKIHKPMEELL